MLLGISNKTIQLNLSYFSLYIIRSNGAVVRVERKYDGLREVRGTMRANLLFQSPNFENSKVSLENKEAT